MDSNLKLVEVSLNHSRSHGLDPVMELNRSGLILTDARRREVELRTLERIINFLDSTPAHHILAVGSGNLAEDYRRALIEKLRGLHLEGEQKLRSDLGR